MSTLQKQKRLLKKSIFWSLLMSVLFLVLFNTNVLAALPAPTGLKANSGNGEVTLYWNAVSGAVKHKISRATSSDGKYKHIANNITSTSFTNTGVDNETTYWYKVAAIDSEGNTSEYSSAVSAKPSAVPAAPTALIAVAGDGQAVLAWEASGSNTSYTVKMKTSSTGSYSTVASGVNNTTFTKSGLTNGSIYYFAINATNSAGTSADSNVARVTPVAPPTGSVYWPLSFSTAVNGDEIRYPYGPRRPGDYDYHAGIDINAPEGTPVYAMMDGTVTNITPDNGSSGPGNKVLVNHGNKHWTGYLHLSAFASGLTVGQTVQAGDLIGYVGHTGANSDHLHITYMVGLTSETNNESRSKNPMEILPHSQPTVTAAFRTDTSNTVDINIPVQQNTIRWIILKGQGQTKIADYYDIVGQGSTNRNNQSQYGMYIDVDTPVDPYPAGGGNLHLFVRPDPVSSFIADRIIIKDFNGNTLIDKAK
ncbi:M23 family metallopeptidase [Paenibacillus sp. Soil724D2]|uniref:M23 family metallopeptidase n=1 Tax=Paenibacillus sp. (strain Soil724D2) TaxID=1736392 RepID=UPI0007143907|nr:M23 family metallopeptidase [Paenibacillus sp. Soil724D2]KRE45716.1 hypothetical protein ASG85_06745 [Paenibacillus sp. Soil724D2]